LPDLIGLRFKAGTRVQGAEVSRPLEPLNLIWNFDNREKKDL
jgi:hypothetical protein